jgi:hypothetical protein
MKQLLLFTCFAMLFASCKTVTYTTKPISEKLDTWIGSTENELVVQLGPATSSTSDGKGGKILSYEETNYRTVSQMLSYNPRSIYYGTHVATTKASTYYVQYYVGADSKIYHWRTNLPDSRERQTAPAHGKTIVLVSVLAVVAAVLIYGTTTGF